MTETARGICPRCGSDNPETLLTDCCKRTPGFRPEAKMVPRHIHPWHFRPPASASEERAEELPSAQEAEAISGAGRPDAAPPLNGPSGSPNPSDFDRAQATARQILHPDSASDDPALLTYHRHHTPDSASQERLPIADEVRGILPPVETCEHGVYIKRDCSQCLKREAEEARAEAERLRNHDMGIDAAFADRIAELEVALSDARAEARSASERLDGSRAIVGVLEGEKRELKQALSDAQEALKAIAARAIDDYARDTAARALSTPQRKAE